MNGLLVDTNVILDIATEDPLWFGWSSNTLSYYAEKHPLYINKIIYAEVSVGYQKIEELERALPASVFKRSVLPWEAAFLAGKAYLKYRQLGGARTQPLPDFFIGAHALIDQLALLTRDAKRFKYYFPNLQIISPD